MSKAKTLLIQMAIVLKVYCDVFLKKQFDEAIDELEVQEAKSCEWHYNEGEIVNDEEWIGQCGAAWSFFDGTPKENGMDFCPKCGGKLIEKDTLCNS